MKKKREPKRERERQRGAPPQDFPEEARDEAEVSTQQHPSIPFLFVPQRQKMQAVSPVCSCPPASLLAASTAAV